MIDMSIEPLFISEDKFLANEFEAAQGQEIFVTSNDNKLFKVAVFYDGRKVLLPVKHTPQVKASKLGFNIREFLPEKLPYSMFQQTEAFFRAVMDNPATKGAEAYVQIWRAADGSYFLHVPEQKVSGASVQMTFDVKENQKMVAAGNTPIGDIHSHNTMGAFFSGTDDGDDEKKVGIAGVIGSINQEGCKHKWRFCYGGKDAFIALEFEQIFDVPVQSSFPAEWLKKVNAPVVKTLPYHGGQGGGSYGGYGYRGTTTPGGGTTKHHTRNLREIYRESFLPQ
jgi:PRTRC genetic system protein A